MVETIQLMRYDVGQRYKDRLFVLVKTSGSNLRLKMLISVVVGGGWGL